MTQERRLTVLRAIVEEYVETSEPVGSKAISQRHQLGVSPATIRNDMAALEDEGLIVQPHTSAGRVPTDLGYRLFVDKLAQVRPLSGAERRAVSTLLDGAVDLEDMVARSVRALAALTHQVAIVQYPSVARSALRHLELLALENGRVMAVLIMENGRVEQRVITLPPIGEASGDTAPGLRFVSQTSLAHLRDRVNQLATGQLVSQLVGELGALVQEFTPLERPGISTIIDSLAEGLGEGAPERLVMAGASHLATHPVDFSNT
ncbi:MAG: heat-inducible transcriptional repressor HrcA, partial [Bifidobacteriaceae bacterium]|nr:heat-inducible transcriptional repressor HrcA [Bifidobacteriaceae bacterium]